MLRLGRLILFLALVLGSLSACRQASEPRRAVTATKGAVKVTHTDMQTVDNIDPRPAVMDPPPMLRDEAPPPKPLGQPWETPEPVKLTTADEKIRAALPFAPAIALDPVDGEKISILATTPTFEYKGRVFYFASEANKRTFMAAPEQYAKGAFAHL